MGAFSPHIKIYTSVDYGKIKIDEVRIYKNIYFSNRFFGCWILYSFVYSA